MQKRDPETYERNQDFKCRFCEDAFPSQNDLDQHQEQDHVEEIEKEEERIWTPTR